MKQSIIRVWGKPDNVQLTLKGDGVAIRVHMFRHVLADGYAIISGDLSVHRSTPDPYYGEKDEPSQSCELFSPCHGGGVYFRAGSEAAEYWFRGEEWQAWSVLMDWHRRQVDPG